MHTTSLDRWFVTDRPETAKVLLFCLPYAGGGASAFRSWRRAFPAEVGVQPVQLPGREGRISEPGRFTAAQVTDAILSRADRPYAIYGHSMGARIGFEVVREVRRRGADLPAGLFIGGARPPDLEEPLSVLADASDADLIDRVVQLGGVPPEVFEEPELRDLVLPTLRADFGWLHDYEFVAEDPLPVPMTAFAGDADADAPVAAMTQWERHAGAGFTLHTMPGGHFFLNDELPSMAETITAALPR
ncbi:MAG: thioesterase domain-containing protein [Actinocatenispora sp.]